MFPEMTPPLFRLALVFACLNGGAWALEAPPRHNPATFSGEIAAYAQQPPQTGGIVFTGSSSIRLWSGLKEDFPDLPVVNQGFGGSIANDLIVYFDTVVARHEPKLIVTYTGGNEIHEKLTVQQAFDDYTRFLDMVHDRCPKARVILTSVKVAPVRAMQIPQVRELNTLLEKWVTGKNWIRFLDCTSYLCDAGNQPIPTFYREDLLHLNAAGYEQWKNILGPVLHEEWEKVK